MRAQGLPDREPQDRDTPASQVATSLAENWLVCITQSPDEPAPAEYVAVCTIRADLLAESSRCVEAQCGGHPICRPCFDLGIERGLVVGL